MADNAYVRWWQYLEGRLLIGQILLLFTFIGLTGWIYYSAFYSYVPAAGEQWRCATGESIALFFALLMDGYLLLLCLWQVSLLKKRRGQQAASIWSLTSFLATLLPVGLLIYFF